MKVKVQAGAELILVGYIVLLGLLVLVGLAYGVSFLRDNPFGGR